jgi:hypothetical protein
MNGAINISHANSSITSDIDGRTPKTDRNQTQIRSKEKDPLPHNSEGCLKPGLSRTSVDFDLIFR